MAIRKVPKLPKYLDVAHRTVVCACIGMTLYGTYLLGHRFYRYFTVIKPDRELEERKLMEVSYCLIF